MREEILTHLKKIELQNEIKILYAIESGSRAWGFESTDSDWDVRFIYIHKLDWYLSIDDEKDNIEEILPNKIDISGWEFKKALRLFKKSNPPLLEWLRSPIIYLENFSTAEKLRELAIEYFNPKSCIYHYLHMAEGNFNEFLDRDKVKVKKYFYVLRPILACDWIKENNSMAPMEFEKLLKSQVKDLKIKSEIQKLLSRKISGEELSEEPKNKILNDFLENKIQYYKEYIKSFKIKAPPDTKKLNDIFIDTINAVWK
ncbi:MAG TPA: nucleotidyltransferase domain-containing protein [Ignavibacteria bacterium]|nr:nucleotidyltransferase domain-containing protein [Ignavibacteria bacterium]